MKKKYITVGIRGEYRPKYDDGRCRLTVWKLQGCSDIVKEAERCRRSVLKREAERLYAAYSQKSEEVLDELFRYYDVSCLSELIGDRIRQEMFFLLMNPNAEEVLRHTRNGFLWRPPFDTVPPTDT